MGAIEGLSKAIAWIIVTGIKIIVYPIYICADVVARVCKKILSAISDEEKIGIE